MQEYILNTSCSVILRHCYFSKVIDLELPFKKKSCFKVSSAAKLITVFEALSLVPAESELGYITPSVFSSSISGLIQQRLPFTFPTLQNEAPFALIQLRTVA
jgi:hypothetical protein